MSFFSTETLRIFEASFGETPGDRAVFRFLSHSAGPAGAEFNQMNVTGTLGDPAFFDYECPLGMEADIVRINFQMLDNTVTAAKFGGIAALTNGCKMQLIESGSSNVLLDFLNSDTIKNNTQFAWLSGVNVNRSPGDDQVIVNWPIISALGGPLRMTEGQVLRFVIQDDLSGIDEFKAMIQGKIKPKTTQEF